LNKKSGLHNQIRFTNAVAGKCKKKPCRNQPIACNIPSQ
jgi:hypothetical protein